MPQHKSAEKRVITNERDRQRNVANRSRLRKALTVQRTAADTKAANAALPATTAEIDKAEKKGLIPSGRADRLKSRIARQVRRLSVPK